MSGRSLLAPRRKPLSRWSRRRQHRRMLLIFGATPRERLLTPVTFVCEYCRTRAEQHVVESATKFSIFFIPLFTVSKRYFVACSNCGGTTALTKEQATHGVEWAARNRQMG